MERSKSGEISVLKESFDTTSHVQSEASSFTRHEEEVNLMRFFEKVLTLATVLNPYRCQLAEEELESFSTVEGYLRDQLIKSFMVIFTNEQSRHLLMNQDLIDIAFNCLISSQDLTLEAQRNVAKLASMIITFPKV
mmetsp:Transcript_40226/g.61395  ORF Transcript_40226/g.61395 Transcript_40226/m.61395 type:complete len:136 (-) Transcript_40226:2131-2538(-)